MGPHRSGHNQLEFVIGTKTFLSSCSFEQEVYSEVVGNCHVLPHGLGIRKNPFMSTEAGMSKDLLGSIQVPPPTPGFLSTLDTAECGGPQELKTTPGHRERWSGTPSCRARPLGKRAWGRELRTPLPFSLAIQTPLTTDTFRTPSRILDGNIRVGQQGSSGFPGYI